MIEVPGRRAGAVALPVLCLLLGGGPIEAAAQQSSGSRACVPFDLPRGHWSVEAVRRIEALGIKRVQPATGLVDECLLQSLLDASEGRVDDEAALRMEGWRDRLSEEVARAGGSLVSVRQAVGVVGATAARGVARPGRGEFPPGRTGALSEPDEEVLVGGVESVIQLGSRGWAGVRGELEGNDFRLERLEAAAVLGPLEVTVGRGAASYGTARSGSVVLSEADALDRVQVETTSPFRLPTFLSSVGTFTFSTSVGRLPRSRHNDRPYLWTARGTLKPHDRVTFGINRAAMFGGEGVPITGEKLLSLLIGDVTGLGFENQVVSVEGVMRLPTESVVPITAYLEWGAEDAAGAWWDVPGRVGGFYLPAVPGLPGASLTIEYSRFAESCCSNPEWYRHWSFPGSWVLRDEPLGHPLGGHGSEWFLRTASHLAEARLRVAADLFTRERGVENLFVPGREGRSYGGALRSEWRFLPGAEISTAAEVEDGRGWTETVLSVSGTIYLQP